MQIKKLWIVYVIIILLITPVFTICVSSEDNNLPPWNKDWSFRQEINLPISTYNSQIKSTDSYDLINLFLKSEVFSSFIYEKLKLSSFFYLFLNKNLY